MLGTVGTRPCCVALRRVLIRGLNPDWLRSFVNWASDYTKYPYTLVGPTVTGPVQDPLAVLLLDIQLYMSADSHLKLAKFITYY